MKLKGVGDKESDSISFILEMGWPKEDTPRSDIVIKDAQYPEGSKAGEAVISELPRDAAGNLPGGSRL